MRFFFQLLSIIICNIFPNLSFLFSVEELNVYPIENVLIDLVQLKTPIGYVACGFLLLFWHGLNIPNLSSLRRYISPYEKNPIPFFNTGSA